MLSIHPSIVKLHLPVASGNEVNYFRCVKRLTPPVFLLLTSFPSIAFANPIEATGWSFRDSDGGRLAVQFLPNGTLRYFSRSAEVLEYNDTYKVVDDSVSVSFYGDYLVCSLTLNSTLNSDLNRMSGTCINMQGLVTEMTGEYIFIE